MFLNKTQYLHYRRRAFYILHSSPSRYFSWSVQPKGSPGARTGDATSGRGRLRRAGAAAKQQPLLPSPLAAVPLGRRHGWQRQRLSLPRALQEPRASVEIPLLPRLCRVLAGGAATPGRPPDLA